FPYYGPHRSAFRDSLRRLCRIPRSARTTVKITSGRTGRSRGLPPRNAAPCADWFGETRLWHCWARQVKFRFWIALIAELALFASLNLFDDWALQLMPVKFVAAAIACGLAYLMATAEFDTTEKNAAALFWVVTIAMRLLALPLEPANEVWRYQADGAIQRAGLNPYKTSPLDACHAIKVADIAAFRHNDEPAAYAPGAEILFRAVPMSKGALVYKSI